MLRSAGSDSSPTAQSGPRRGQLTTKLGAKVDYCIHTFSKQIFGFAFVEKEFAKTNQGDFQLLNAEMFNRCSLAQLSLQPSQKCFHAKLSSVVSYRVQASTRAKETCERLSAVHWRLLGVRHFTDCPKQEC